MTDNLHTDATVLQLAREVREIALRLEALRKEHAAFHAERAEHEARAGGAEQHAKRVYSEIVPLEEALESAEKKLAEVAACFHEDDRSDEADDITAGVKAIAESQGGEEFAGERATASIPAAVVAEVTKPVIVSTDIPGRQPSDEGQDAPETPAEAVLSELPDDDEGDEDGFEDLPEDEEDEEDEGADMDGADGMAGESDFVQAHEEQTVINAFSEVSDEDVKAAAVEDNLEEERKSRFSNPFSPKAQAAKNG